MLFVRWAILGNKQLLRDWYELEFQGEIIPSKKSGDLEVHFFKISTYDHASALKVTLTK